MSKAQAATQTRPESIQIVLDSLNADYESLSKEIPRLGSLSGAKPTLLAMLYLDRASERFATPTWASLPGDAASDPLHRTLLAQDKFLDFLTATSSSGSPLLSSNEALRVYSSTLIASRIFHIPPNLLLCLLVQESKLSPSALSVNGAEGVGQLTDVGVQQVAEILEQSPRWKGRLKDYESALSKLYSDPDTLSVLRALSPKFRLPAFSKIHHLDASGVANPETNVALSAMLFRYYMRYPWALGQRRLLLPFSLRCGLAVIAYNQGPRAALKILKNIRQTGLLDLSTLDIERLMQLYTPEFVDEAVGGDPVLRSRELYRHFLSVMSCAHAVGEKGLLSSEGPAVRSSASRS